MFFPLTDVEDVEELSLLDNIEDASSEKAESVSGLQSAPPVDFCFRNLIL